MSRSPLPRADDGSGALKAAALAQEAGSLQRAADATCRSTKGEALLWPVPEQPRP